MNALAQGFRWSPFPKKPTGFCRARSYVGIAIADRRERNDSCPLSRRGNLDRAVHPHKRPNGVSRTRKGEVKRFAALATGVCSRFLTTDVAQRQGGKSPIAARTVTTQESCARRTQQIAASECWSGWTLTILKQTPPFTEPS